MQLDFFDSITFQYNYQISDNRLDEYYQFGIYWEQLFRKIVKITFSGLLRHFLLRRD